MDETLERGLKGDEDKKRGGGEEAEEKIKNTKRRRRRRKGTSSVFWDIPPCSPLKFNQHFGGTCGCLQFGKINRARN
jgi:hypothetical protein